MRYPTRLRVLAHGKLNLGLTVTGRRPDGFHEITTLFARLELADEVTVEVLPGRAGVTLELPGGRQGGITGATESPGLPVDHSNLAVRAANAFLRAASLAAAHAVHLKLLKRIPIAAGLGGGSADAGAVLRALDHMFPEALTRRELEALALEMGSDVPFFLLDTAAAVGRGRGELLEPVELEPFHVVLANPGVAVGAGEAYAQVRTFSPPPAPEALQRAGGPEALPANDLQAGVISLQPVVGTVLSALEGAGLQGVQMSGSGATCFGRAGSEGQARAAAQAVKAARPDWWVWSGRAGV